MELPLSISNLQEQWLLSFLKKLDPVNIAELFWQLRPYVVLHHVEFKESSFSFLSVGSINFVDIVGFVREEDTLGILLKNGRFYFLQQAWTGSAYRFVILNFISKRGDCCPVGLLLSRNSNYCGGK